MKIQVKYFGEVAELVGSHEEFVDFDQAMDTKTFEQWLNARIDLSGTDYKVAVNRELAQDLKTIKEGDEVAVLPPFAGG